MDNKVRTCHRMTKMFGRCTFCGKLGFLKPYTQFIFVGIPLCSGCYDKSPLEHLGFKFPKTNVTLHIEWYEPQSSGEKTNE